MNLVFVANAGDGTITSLRLDTAGEPTLEPLTTTTVGEGCGTLAVDAARGLVYAATKEPAVVTLRVDAVSGDLTEVSRCQIDVPLAYISLAQDGGLVLGASYDGNCALTWPVTDGVLAENVARVSHANAHCIRPVGDTAYVVALGDDEIGQYCIERDGRLTPLDPATADAPEGAGPRHLIVDGTNAYLVTEFSGEAIRFDVAGDGTLTRAEAVRIDDPKAGLGHSNIEADPAAEHLRWGAEIQRIGSWLFASERTASTIATVRVGGDGRLGQVVSVTSTEKQPRAFAVTPDGGHLVVVGEKSPQAALLRIQDDGSLTEVSTAPVGETARWVAFV